MDYDIQLEDEKDAYSPHTDVQNVQNIQMAKVSILLFSNKKSMRVRPLIKVPPKKNTMIFHPPIQKHPLDAPSSVKFSFMSSSFVSVN